MNSGPSDVHRLPATTSRRGLVIGLAMGVPIIAYGIRGVVIDASDTHPGELARWVVGAAVVHDALLAPMALVAVWGLRRIVPAFAWPAVRAGLPTTGVLCLVAWPLVPGYGEDPSIPSLLSRNYGTGLAAALGAIRLSVAVWAAIARHRS